MCSVKVGEAPLYSHGKMVRIMVWALLDSATNGHVQYIHQIRAKNETTG